MIECKFKPGDLVQIRKDHIGHFSDRVEWENKMLTVQDWHEGTLSCKNENGKIADIIRHSFFRESTVTDFTAFYDYYMYPLRDVEVNIP